MTSSHLRGLNGPQATAVKTTAGPLLVLAGAGTGKTRVVTARIAEILAKGAPPGAICAVTFTNKAAEEMRERVAALLQRKDLGDMVVSTFHSLGLRILREFGEPVGGGRGANVADESDQNEILQDALKEVSMPPKAMRAKDARFRISLWKNMGKSPEDIWERPEEEHDQRLAQAWERYDQELRRRKLLDFDDLILLPLKLLESEESARSVLQERWRWLLVDEFQDTNACQFRLIRALAGERMNLCVVGDDDQSIYGWRGADADRILRFTQDVPATKVVTLEQNYRSTNAILRAAHQLIVRNQRRRPKTLWSELGVGETVTLYVAKDEQDELDYLVSTVASAKARSGFKFEDVAVLFRANAQCRPLELALRARDYPYRVVGTRSFFDRREVRDLLAFLRLAHSTRDDSAFVRIANIPPRGLGRTTVDKAVARAAELQSSAYEVMRTEPSRFTPAAQRGFQDLHAALADLRAAEPFGPGFEAFLSRIHYRDHLRQTIDEPLELQTRLKVVDELVETATSGANSSGLGAFLDSLALRDDASRRRRKDDKAEDAISLITMHAAKGLEFDTVFVIGLEDGVIPHQRSLAAADAEGILDDDLAPEEERRLLYVAMTRARRRLILSHAETRQRFGREVQVKPSRFLAEIGEEFFERRTAADDKPADEETGKAWLRSIRERFREDPIWEAE